MINFAQTKLNKNKPVSNFNKSYLREKNEFFSNAHLTMLIRSEERNMF